MSDEQLWRLMFGATIPRSWMVWSNGNCPSCDKPVPMYDWKIDAIKEPWKLRCPHCKEQFPKNDFAKFHESGLDAHGVFDPKKADRSLLFNGEHPDPEKDFPHYCRPDATRVCGDDLLGSRLLVGNVEVRVPLSGIRSRQIDYGIVPGRRVCVRRRRPHLGRREPRR